MLSVADVKQNVAHNDALAENMAYHVRLYVENAEELVVPTFQCQTCLRMINTLIVVLSG